MLANVPRLLYSIWMLTNVYTVTAQKPGSNNKRNVETFNYGIHLTVPTIQMRDLVDNRFMNLGLGLNVQYLIDPAEVLKKKSWVRIGAAINYSSFGRYITSTDVGKLKTRYGVGNLNVICRLRPIEDKKFVPFLESSIGLSSYFSNTKWKEPGNIEPFNTENLLKTLYYYTPGKSIGVGVKIGEPNNNEGLVIKCQYYWAGSTLFVPRNSISYDAYSNNFTYSSQWAELRYFTLTVAIESMENLFKGKNE